MAFLSQSFAVDELPQGSGGNFEPLPAGWYQATITSAELKKTKAGTGEYIAIRYDILGPTHQGRVVFGNLNIANPNQKAEEIGRQQLRELMVSIGLNSVSDTDQLIGLTSRVTSNTATRTRCAGSSLPAVDLLRRRLLLLCPRSPRLLLHRLPPPLPRLHRPG
jgi:hypothetical protein